MNIECPVRSYGGLYLFSNDDVTQNKFEIGAKANGNYSSSWEGLSIVVYDKNSGIVSGYYIADYNESSYGNLLSNTVKYSSVVDYIRFYSNNYSYGNYTGSLKVFGMKA